jgi:hypothetical protein
MVRPELPGQCIIVRMQPVRELLLEAAAIHFVRRARPGAGPRRSSLALPNPG